MVRFWINAENKVCGKHRFRRSYTFCPVRSFSLVNVNFCEIWIIHVIVLNARKFFIIHKVQVNWLLLYHRTKRIRSNKPVFTLCSLLFQNIISPFIFPIAERNTGNSFPCFRTTSWRALVLKQITRFHWLRCIPPRSTQDRGRGAERAITRHKISLFQQVAFFPAHPSE